MTQTITLHVKQLTTETGYTKIIVVTPSQWAGIKRKNSYKSIISKKELASLTIKIKTK